MESNDTWKPTKHSRIYGDVLEFKAAQKSGQHNPFFNEKRTG